MCTCTCAVLGRQRQAIAVFKFIKQVDKAIPPRAVDFPRADPPPPAERGHPKGNAGTDGQGRSRVAARRGASKNRSTNYDTTSPLLLLRLRGGFPAWKTLEVVCLAAEQRQRQVQLTTHTHTHHAAWCGMEEGQQIKPAATPTEKQQQSKTKKKTVTTMKRRRQRRRLHAHNCCSLFTRVCGVRTPTWLFGYLRGSPTHAVCVQ